MESPREPGKESPGPAFCRDHGLPSLRLVPGQSLLWTVWEKNPAGPQGAHASLSALRKFDLSENSPGHFGGGDPWRQAADDPLPGESLQGICADRGIYRDRGDRGGHGATGSDGGGGAPSQGHSLLWQPALGHGLQFADGLLCPSGWGG